MLRAFAIVVVIIGLVAAAVFGPRWLMSDEEDAATGAVHCNLLAGPCRWENAGDKWQAELSRASETGDGQDYHLTLKTTAGGERLLAVLRGESMYLGEYPVPLERREAQTWQATFTAPFCTTEPDMTWRVDLQQGQQPLAGVPVALVFEARGA